ncbi:hypothetical protein BKA63DRAFT_65448 [Paraphoma chrysanthemicola]|nr:hypothetical protein BKA63DRAFT_65448 [Paraphoma chrysanthemicola]
MAPDKKQKGEHAPDAESKKEAIPDEDVRQESSKAACAAMNAQERAKELKEAAIGAGSPEERQKLMEQAIDAQIEAESFGKTARYLRSGTFQGAAVGTGIGVAPGATLGALTGTLVGGVTSTITGSLGFGIGAAAGSLHGPFWNLGELAGKGVRKFTGDFPGWAASKEQKQTLEKMIGQVQEEDMPGEAELKRLHEEGGAAVPGEGWMTTTKNLVSSMGTTSKASPSSTQGKDNASKPGQSQKSKNGNAATETSSRKKEPDDRRRPRKLESASDDPPAGARKKPRKLETRSKDSGAKQTEAKAQTSFPRKLERRSSP